MDAPLDARDNVEVLVQMDVHLVAQDVLDVLQDAKVDVRILVRQPVGMGVGITAQMDVEALVQMDVLAIAKMAVLVLAYLVAPVRAKDHVEKIANPTVILDAQNRVPQFAQLLVQEIVLDNATEHLHLDHKKERD